jgi:hypothetical protein
VTPPEPVVGSLPVTAPTGMTVRFRYYNASNNWHWVVGALLLLGPGLRRLRGGRPHATKRPSFASGRSTLEVCL